MTLSRRALSENPPEKSNAATCVFEAGRVAGLLPATRPRHFRAAAASEDLPRKLDGRLRGL